MNASNPTRSSSPANLPDDDVGIIGRISVCIPVVHSIFIITCGRKSTLLSFFIFYVAPYT